MEYSFEPFVDFKEFFQEEGFRFDGGRWHYDFGNGIVEIVQTQKMFDEVYFCSGYIRTSRSISELRFVLPLKVDSYETCLALFAYYLRNGEIEYAPEWLIKGLALSDILPWNRDRKEYENNPKAILEHEWYKLLNKKLRELGENAHTDDVTTFSFDGSVLKVFLNEEQIFALAGKGTAWLTSARILASNLRDLPKRLPVRSFSIEVWKGRLRLYNRSYPLIFDDIKETDLF